MTLGYTKNLTWFLLPGPLLVWDSSVIGGSASSWIVGTEASKPEKNTDLRCAPSPIVFTCSFVWMCVLELQLSHFFIHEALRPHVSWHVSHNLCPSTFCRRIFFFYGLVIMKTIVTEEGAVPEMTSKKTSPSKKLGDWIFSNSAHFKQCWQ